MTGFTQLGLERLLVLYHRCMEEFDHRTKVVRRIYSVAGDCSSQGAGYVDGEGKDARFGYLTDVVFFNSSLIIVADQINNAIRQVNNTSTHTVSTLISRSAGLYRPYKLGLNNVTLYITSYAILYEFDMIKGGPLKVVTGGRVGYADGDFSTAQFNNLQGVVTLYDYILILIDTHNNRLRLLNLESKTVSSLCAGGVCEIIAPQSIGFKLDNDSNNTIYIGRNGSIDAVDCKYTCSCYVS